MTKEQFIVIGILKFPQFPLTEMATRGAISPADFSRLSGPRVERELEDFRNCSEGRKTREKVGVARSSK